MRFIEACERALVFCEQSGVNVFNTKQNKPSFLSFPIIPLLSEHTVYYPGAPGAFKLVNHTVKIFESFVVVPLWLQKWTLPKTPVSSYLESVSPPPVTRLVDIALL